MGIREYLRTYGASYRPKPPGSLQYSGGLVVCGDAACIWSDLESFGCRSDNSVAKDGWEFMTVNKLVEVFPGHIEHAYSHSAQALESFINARRHEYREEFVGPRYTHSLHSGTDVTWNWSGHGTSSLGAALTAVALGYDRVVLCGIPLDNGPHNGEPHWRKTHFETSEAVSNPATGMDDHWKRAVDLAFEGKVKSMSGRTRQWLGQP